MKKTIILKLITLNILFSQSIPYFDSEKAFDYIKKQCEFGPRYPGSSGHYSFQLYLREFLKDKSDTLIVYEHEVKHPYAEKNVMLYNFLARYNPTIDNRIMLMAHWDTREIADKDLEIENQNKPILGANDGGSGISVLMVLSEILNKNKLYNIGIDLLFVDGEDMGRNGQLENYCIGTTAFCEVIPDPIPNHAICIDMVADKNPVFPIEYFSYNQAPHVVNEIWTLAHELGYKEFESRLSGPIYDDHRALYIHSGIPAIDIIDFDYPYWHTTQDIVENCSPKGLKIVGEVICEYLYRKDYEN
tara:strand:+ start:128 stop:1033 length:906 start_codon:yes stop_codon:yes gene_type:complete